MNIVFYSAPQSSATPVAWALAELEVPHEAVSFNLKQGEQKQPEFLQLNPNGKVPTLVVDGTPLFEALAILQWLGDKFGVAQGIWPAADTPARLEALSWTAWVYVTYSATIQRLNYAQSEAVDPALRHPGQAEVAKKDINHLLSLLDGRLRGRGFLLGPAFSLADLIVGAVVIYGTYCGASVDAHPNVKKWLGTLQERDAFRRAWA